MEFRVFSCGQVKNEDIYLGMPDISDIFSG